MAKDKPRCQAIVLKGGKRKRCGVPIEYGSGGVFQGWEHEVYVGEHMVVQDTDWIVDHENKTLRFVG